MTFPELSRGAMRCHAVPRGLMRARQVPCNVDEKVHELSLDFMSQHGNFTILIETTASLTAPRDTLWRLMALHETSWFPTQPCDDLKHITEPSSGRGDSYSKMFLRSSHEELKLSPGNITAKAFVRTTRQSFYALVEKSSIYS